MHNNNLKQCLSIDLWLRCMHDIYDSWEIQCPYNALLYLLSYFYLNNLVNEIEKYFYPSFFGHLWNCYCYFKIYAFGLYCFKMKVLTTFKMSSDCYINISQFVKRKVFWKSQVPFFRRNWELGKHLKKVRSSQASILINVVLNWVKHSFPLWVSLKTTF